MTPKASFVGALTTTLVGLALVGYLSAIWGPKSADLGYAIWQIRLPRFGLAALLGAALGLAGLAIQLATRNPLSEPELLGINQSAVFAVCATLLLTGSSLAPGAMIAVALVGGLFGGGAILVLSSSPKMTRDRLILAGLTLAFFFGSASHGMLLLRDSDLFELLHWTAGKLSGADTLDLKLAATALFLAVSLAFLRVTQWNVLELGDDSARSLGLDPVGRRVELIAIAVVLCAVTVALAGPIGFVGLMVPHLARWMVGLDHTRVLPITLVLGAFLVSAADLLARTAAQPVEIPVGVVTALIGAPYFLYRAGRL